MTDLKVFISHRHRDLSSAKHLMNTLQEISDNSAEFFLSEGMQHGIDYRTTLKAALQDSEWFLLLYRDPWASESLTAWDWCLYEAGFFEATMRQDDRLSCLHDPDVSPPSALEKFQSIKADQESAEQFVRHFLERIASDLLKKDPKEKIPKAAKEICAAVRGKPTRLYSEKSFVLQINADNTEANSSDDCIPGDALVRAPEAVFNLFDLLVSSPVKWEELERQALAQQDKRWLSELKHAVHRARNRRRFPPVQATFKAFHNGKIYKPVLARVDKLSNDSLEFEVFLIEAVTSQYVGIPAKLAAILTSLNMATRLRYEVLGKAWRDLAVADALRDATKLTDLRTEVGEGFLRIEQEAASRGLMDQQSLKTAFAEERNSERINQIWMRWSELKKKLYDSLRIGVKDGVVTLDRTAPKEDQLLEARRYVDELLKMNCEYINRASRRFGELLTESLECYEDEEV